MNNTIRLLYALVTDKRSLQIRKENDSFIVTVNGTHAAAALSVEAALTLLCKLLPDSWDLLHCGAKGPQFKAVDEMLLASLSNLGEVTLSLDVQHGAQTVLDFRVRANQSTISFEAQDIDTVLWLAHALIVEAPHWWSVRYDERLTNQKVFRLLLSLGGMTPTQQEVVDGKFHCLMPSDDTIILINLLSMQRMLDLVREFDTVYSTPYNGFRDLVASQHSLRDYVNGERQTTCWTVSAVCPASISMQGWLAHRPGHRFPSPRPAR